MEVTRAFGDYTEVGLCPVKELQPPRRSARIYKAYVWTLLLLDSQQLTSVHSRFKESSALIWAYIHDTKLRGVFEESTLHCAVLFPTDLEMALKQGYVLTIKARAPYVLRSLVSTKRGLSSSVPRLTEI